MTLRNSTGHGADPPASNEPSAGVQLRRDEPNTLVQGAPSATQHNVRSPHVTTKSANMTVRFVFHQSPTEQQCHAKLRHFLARFLKINVDNRHANLQLLPLVDGGGDHIQALEALGHGRTMDGYARNKDSKHFDTATGRVYSHYVTFRAQHDMSYSRIKYIMLPWLQVNKCYLNQDTSAANLAPVGWIKGVSHRAANLSTLAEELSQLCRDSYNANDDTLQPVSQVHRNKFGPSLGPEAFSLQANVTHLSEKDEHSMVIQLSVPHSLIVLALELLGNCRSKTSYTVVSATTTGNDAKKALADHNATLKGLRFVFIDNWTEAHTTIEHEGYAYSTLANTVATCKGSTGGLVFNGLVQIRPSTIALKVNAAQAKLAKETLEAFLPYAHQTAHPSSLPILRLNGLHLAPSLAPIPRNSWGQQLPPRSSRQVSTPPGRPAPHQGRQVTIADASTTSTLTTMTHSLQQLTEQMAKGFASVTTMQTTVASLTEQLQQERQHSAALSKQVSKLEDNLSKLSVTVSGILNQATNFAPPAFTPEIFQTILEQALGSFAEGFVNASSQASSSQSSPQSSSQLSPRTPTRSLSPSSAQAFTPQSKRLRRNESDLDQCEQHMDNFRGDLPPIEDSQETLTTSATTAFDYVLNEWDDDSPQASLSMQVRLDQLNQSDDGALKSVSPVVLTITDSSVPAPATQPACGTPSQPPFSPVARNTRQKKPITQAPQAPVDKQWAGGKH